MRRSKKAQSTLEYIIVLAAIIAAIIIFATQGFSSKYTTALNSVTDRMANVLNRVKY